MTTLKRIFSSFALAAAFVIGVANTLSAAPNDDAQAQAQALMVSSTKAASAHRTAVRPNPRQTPTLDAQHQAIQFLAPSREFSQPHITRSFASTKTFIDAQAAARNTLTNRAAIRPAQ